MRFFIFLCFIVFVPTLATALPSPLKEEEVLRGDFVQMRYLKGFEKPLRSDGRFVVVPDQGVLWSVSKPFPMTTIIAPNKLLQKHKGRKLMELTAAKAPFISTLYKMIGGALSGQWSALEKDFSIHQTVQEPNWSVTLQPLKQEDAFVPFTQIVVKGTSHVKEVILDKPSGDRDVLTFTNVKIKKGALTKLEQNLFKVDGV